MKKRRLCTILLPVFLWLLCTGVYREEKEIPCTFQDGTRLTAEGIIYEIQTKENQQIIYIKNISISDNNHSLSEKSADKKAKMKIELQNKVPLQIGNRIQVQGICQNFSKAKNDGAFDAQKFYARQDMLCTLKKAELRKKNNSIQYMGEACRIVKETCKKILRRLMKTEEAGVLESILLGDRTDLDADIRDLYQKNGIIHVLAISGLHVSLMGTTLFQFLRKRRLGFTMSACLSGVLIWMYGMMTGFPTSATRAILMFMLFLGAQITGRTVDLPTSMAVAGWCMLMKDTRLLFQSGFLLSYAAVGGVAAAQALPQKNKYAEALKVSIMTWLTTLPLTAYFYYQVPMYGVMLNLFVIPSMSVMILLGAAGILVGSISTVAGTFVLAPVHYLLQITFFLCRQCRKLPGAVWTTGRPAIWQMLLYYLIICFMLTFLPKMKKIDLIKTAFGIILGIGILNYRSAKGLSVTFLDVGQGDGICIQTEKRHAWMVDGGSSTTNRLADICLEPYLNYWGISEVEGWIVSHFDMDHVSGLLQILESYRRGFTGKNCNGITIKRILIPDIEEEEDLQKQIMTLAGKYGIPVSRCAAGDQIEQDNMKLAVLNPVSGMHYSSGNAASMAVRLAYQDFSALLTGDLEEEGEEELLEQKIEPVKVLKVAHHGSRNSSSEEFLREAGGKVAVISCGFQNSYGHPHPELVQRLKKMGYQILRTDQDGMVRFRVKKGVSYGNGKE